MTQIKRRTDAFDATIRELNAEINKTKAERHTKLRDMKAPPEDLGAISVRLRALSDKLADQQELRKAAAALDQRDAFLRERGRIKALAEEMFQIIGSREADAEELDKLCVQFGNVLQRIHEKNRDAWAKFREVSYALTDGVPRVRDQLIYANQARLSGAACGPALAAALKTAGIGKTGIHSEILYSLSSYRDEDGRTVQEAMREANERVERHLMLVFRQVADEAAVSLDAEGQ